MICAIPKAYSNAPEIPRINTYILTIGKTIVTASGNIVTCMMCPC